MRKLNLTIVPGEPAPPTTAFESVRTELVNVRKSLSQLNVLLAGVAIAGLAALEATFLKARVNSDVASAMYGLGLIGFLLGHLYEKTLTMRIAELDPIPANLLVEAAALCHVSATATAYLAGVRAQKRELRLAELEAIRRLVAATPPELAREILYKERPQP